MEEDLYLKALYLEKEWFDHSHSLFKTGKFDCDKFESLYIDTIDFINIEKGNEKISRDYLKVIWSMFQFLSRGYELRDIDEVFYRNFNASLIDILDFVREKHEEDLQYNLGEIYYYIAVDLLNMKKIELGKKFYLKSGENGNADSYFFLAELIEKSEENELEKVKNYYMKSLESGCVYASFPLGRIYFNEKNYVEALKYLSISIEYEYNEACYYLGKMYLDGLGVKKDSIKAIECFDKALTGEDISEQIMDYCSLEVAKCYYYGLGVDQNYDEAFNIFYIMSRHSSIDIEYEAKYYLARMYYYGEHVKQNKMIALGFLKKLEEEGYNLAIEFLEKEYRP